MQVFYDGRFVVHSINQRRLQLWFVGGIFQMHSIFINCCSQTGLKRVIWFYVDLYWKIYHI